MTSAPANARPPQPPPFLPRPRVLLGPGPSETDPSVLLALAQPTIGHLDPQLLAAQDELRAMLQHALGAPNAACLALSGTGTSGMECCLANLIEPGDAVLVAACGYFGERMAEVARRCGARVELVQGTWGRALDLELVRTAARGARFKLLCCVQAETSTGVRQELAPLRALADELGALLVVDAVTSFGTIELDFERSGIDALYSCSQKGLACVSGLSPVAFSPRAQAALAARRTPVQSFYLDLRLLLEYWGGARGYHHTVSSNLLAALHQALRLVLAEGLEARWARHARLARSLWSELEGLGLELLVPEPERLAPLCAVRVPTGVDELAVRRELLARHGIEIGGGLGPLKGAIWRIGLMGAGASERNALLLVAALREALTRAQRGRG